LSFSNSSKYPVISITFSIILLAGYISLRLLNVDIISTKSFILAFAFLDISEFPSISISTEYKLSSFKLALSSIFSIVLSPIPLLGTFIILFRDISSCGFCVSKAYNQKYRDSQDKLEKKSIKAMILKSSLEPTYQAIALIGLFFVIYMCGMKVMNETWLIGTFSAYLTTYVLVANKTSKIGKIFNAITTLKVSWKRCSSYLKAKEPPKEITYPTDKLRLEVNNLTFGFDQSFVLHNISFHLNKGETLGVCGMIHSGKSTLGAALSGLYDYDGSIKLQGVELKEVRNDLANNFISYAPSQTEIFNDTIRYNIACENAEVNKEIHLSYLDEDINSFENKEDELLSHSIANLSGGQQKRLQISRGLYNSPKLIVMDDPFNAIDLEMSKKITDNIIKEYKESIFVLINNQKEILQKMDYIIFLKHDSYIYGTYEEMMKDLDFLKLIGGKQNECN